MRGELQITDSIQQNFFREVNSCLPSQKVLRLPGTRRFTIIPCKPLSFKNVVFISNLSIKITKIIWLSSGMLRRAVWLILTDVSQKITASIISAYHHNNLIPKYRTDFSFFHFALQFLPIRLILRILIALYYAVFPISLLIPLNPNILLSDLFSNTRIMRPSLHMRDQRLTNILLKEKIIRKLQTERT